MTLAEVQGAKAVAAGGEGGQAGVRDGGAASQVHVTQLVTKSQHLQNINNVYYKRSMSLIFYMNLIWNKCFYYFRYMSCKLRMADKAQGILIS